MRILVVELDWFSAYTATKILLACYGVIGLIAFFAGPLPWFILIPSVFAVAVMWLLAYTIARAVKARKDQNESRNIIR